ncbi:MAG: DUF6491 family protein [Rhodospirillaceae bacterium]
MFSYKIYVYGCFAVALPVLLGGNALADTQVSQNALAEKAETIHFADRGGIKDWRATSNEELYVESRNDQWYKVTFNAPCTSLKFANTIAFVTEPNGDLDKFSAVIVDDQRCFFDTFERVDGPPA